MGERLSEDRLGELRGLPHQFRRDRQLQRSPEVLADDLAAALIEAVAEIDRVREGGETGLDEISTYVLWKEIDRRTEGSLYDDALDDLDRIHREGGSARDTREATQLALAEAFAGIAQSAGVLEQWTVFVEARTALLHAINLDL